MLMEAYLTKMSSDARYAPKAFCTDKHHITAALLTMLLWETEGVHNVAHSGTQCTAFCCMCSRM